jgi:1,4-alpha-glucan branching enzyme
MQQREHLQSTDRPMSIYEVHLGSWRKKGPEGSEFLTYRDLADELVPYVKDLGFTHIELMPVAEHPFDPSWGYQITNYFAPTSRFGEPKDFMHFVNRCHREGIGVIMDWVPGHFPKDEQALQMFDGSPLYEHVDPLRREQKDWGTHVFDYGKPEVCSFLISNASYWCRHFHIDGLRVDAVASMLYLDYSKEDGEWSPNVYGGNQHLEAINFLRSFNTTLHEHHPGVISVAEESTSWPGVTQPAAEGGLGFDYKWNMGWMNDTLSFMEMKPGEREHSPRKITFPLVYATHEKFVLPLSHDEVVHLKKPLVRKSPVNEAEQFANLRLLYTYMLGHPGKKLLFMGGEFAQTSEWAEDRPLDWHLLQYDPHKGVQKLVGDLLHLYRREPALHQCEYRGESFEWIELSERRPGLFAFLRKAINPADHLFFILNFSNNKVDDYKPGPFRGTQYELLINTDSSYYGGTDSGGHGGHASEQAAGLAPFSGLILKSTH